MINKKYGYIYKTINIKNGKIYIGQKKGEFNSDYFGSGLLINKAINKEGIQNFKLEIIVYAKNKIKLNELEKYYITKYRKIFGREKLYNLADGGGGGNSCHKSNCQCCFCQTKRGEYKNRKHKKGCKCCSCQATRGVYKGKNNGMHGKYQSEEAREKIRKGNIEYVKLHGSYERTETHRKKMGKVRKQQWQDPKYRAKQLKASLKRWQNPKFRKKMLNIRKNRVSIKK